MYHNLVFYLEACESGSMFHGLLPSNISGEIFVLDYAYFRLCHSFSTITIYVEYLIALHCPLIYMKSQIISRHFKCGQFEKTEYFSN